MNGLRPSTTTAALMFAVSLACASVCGAQTSDAEREQQALALARDGLVARRERRDADALAAFERSLALSERASVRAQLGFAQQALGRWVDAEQTLARVAALDDPWVRRYRATIDESLAAVRAHLGWLSLAVDPADSEVLVDGVVLNARTDIRIPIGAVTVTARREGRFSVERSVSILPGQTTTETIVLRPRPIEPQPVVARVERAIRAPVVVLPPPRAQERPRDNRGWIGPSVTVGVGAVTVGVAAALWALRERSLGALRELGCVETASEFVCASGAVDEARARAVHTDAGSTGTASAVTVIVGGATLAAGAAWVVIEALSRGRERRALTLSPGGVRWVF
jgi:hypothetical protein